MKVESSAPTRVDLAGGTVDIWPLYLFHPGAQTVNFAINLFATCRIESRDDNIVRLESKDTGSIVESSLENFSVDCDLELLARLVKFFAPNQGLTMITECSAPPGSGLGGSSALDIAVCGALNAFTERNYNEEDLLTIAKNIETQVIKVPAGVQDYYPAMYGGVNNIELKVAGVFRQAINTDLAVMSDRLVLCYTGKPHFSGTNNWEITKRHIDSDATIFDQFERIRDISNDMHDALINNDFNRVAQLLDREWLTRKELSPGVSTDKIEELISSARNAGAVAAKVCGAGGGGCMIVVAGEGRSEDVKQALRNSGGEILEFQIVPHGLSVKIS